MKQSRPRRRVLSEAERDLWARVVETVDRLPGRRAPAPTPPPEPAAPPAAAEPPAPPPLAPSRPAPRYAPPPLTSLAPLEARLRRRLARGVVEIDARIDLHGLRQEEAHRRLNAFLSGAQSRGCKVVLVITGKGGVSADPHAERGVLRRAVPIWLSAPGTRSVVVGFESADAVHGGAGALYVRIRKPGRG